MKKQVLLASMLVIAVAVSIPTFGAAAGSAEEAGVKARTTEKAPSPQAVSPARPDIQPPGARMTCCCGPCCMQGGMRKPMGMMDRPMPAPGMHGPGGGKKGCRDRGMHGKMAGGMRERGGKRGIQGLIRHASVLGLSDEQVEKLEEIAYDTKLELIDLRSSLEKARLALRRELKEENDDLRTIRKHLDKVAKLQADIKEARIAAMLQAKKILTDEQKKLIEEKMPRLGRILN